jgi:hypothetical protein
MMASLARMMISSQYGRAESSFWHRRAAPRSEFGCGTIAQSAGVTVKSSKYMWLSAFDHKPIRPETGSGRTCSK